MSLKIPLGLWSISTSLNEQLCNKFVYTHLSASKNIPNGKLNEVFTFYKQVGAFSFCPELVKFVTIKQKKNVADREKLCGEVAAKP